MKISKLAIGIVCIALVTSALPAGAQGLEWSLTPFFWASALDGDIRVQILEAEVDTPFSDLADALEFALPLHVEAKGPVWTLISELNFVALGGDIGVKQRLGTWDVDMLTFELLSGWQFSNQAELIFGARYVSLDTSLKIDRSPSDPTFSARASFDQDWIDPVVGLRYAGEISRRWTFSLRGDAGGFGLGAGSDLTINLRAGVGVDLSDKTTLRFGWHAFDTDYENDNLKYDILQQGPEIGLTIKL